MIRPENKTALISNVVATNKLSVMAKTVMLYLLACKEAKWTIEEIADDFALLPTELLRLLMDLEKEKYIKIQIVVTGDEDGRTKNVCKERG